MSVSILEALMNADHNIQNNGALGVIIASGQLHNAIELLLKGYNLDTQIDPLIEEYGNIESVPLKKDDKK